MNYRSFLLPALLLLPGLLHCGEKGCTLVGCLSAVHVRTVDSGGQVVTGVFGQVSFDGQGADFNCGNGPNNSTVLCQADGFVIPGPGEGKSVLDFNLQDADGHLYQGSVTPTYTTQEDFNGPGCGTCTNGEVTVTLD